MHCPEAGPHAALLAVPYAARPPYEASVLFPPRERVMCGWRLDCSHLTSGV